MTGPLKQKIRDSGIKMNHLAKMINVTPTYFYMCMSGERTLKPEKEKVIREFIDRMQA